MRIVVCTVGGWLNPWDLPASGFIDRPWISGGERFLYELAVAAAVLGAEVELRGDLHRGDLEALCDAAGARPNVELPPRRPQPDDVVIVPEGWPDPLHYARIVLSPARAVMVLLAPPGLFGWPLDPAWIPPDPLTVPIDAVGRPEQYRNLAAAGFELWTQAPVIAAEARSAGVRCALLRNGSPLPLPEPVPREVDVAVVANNRWATLAQKVLGSLEVNSTIIPTVDHETMLQLLGSARILLWPSRIEGTCRLQTEARAMGTVPVALRSNRYALGLNEDEGAVVVDSVSEMGPAAHALLRDEPRLHELSSRGIKHAREWFSWDPFLERVGAELAAEPPTQPGIAARAGLGGSVDGLVDDLEGQVAARDEEFRAYRARRSIRVAERMGNALGRPPKQADS